MGIKNAAKKTIAYAKRNGARAAFFAAIERLSDNRKEKYTYNELSEAVLNEQKQEYKALAETGGALRFSIVVPLFNTPEKYLRQMIDSVVAQTYGNWELVLADASPLESDLVKEYMKEDPRIKYYYLGSNEGISENTNRGIEKAKGDYICLLDHDDLLTPDALYEVSRVIRKSMSRNHLTQFQTCPIRLIYSDEDKFDDHKNLYYEHHQKPSFNLDYLLSNNYICHFTVMRADIIKRLKFRKKYDGAQDFDLVLRACLEATLTMPMATDQIAHIDKVLYHWRCHKGSTASNPASKMYAYEAGQIAIGDALKNFGVEAEIAQLPHLGFYRAGYVGDIFSQRKDIGCVGGKLINKKGRVAGGIYKKDGTAVFKGMPFGYSGGLQHKAVVQQDCYAVDIRCMALRPELAEAFKDIAGFEYEDTFSDLQGNMTDKSHDDVQVESKREYLDKINSLTEEEILKINLKIGEEMKRRGLRVMWDPQVVKKI
jgi:glycosyltransferase involved in cell wall biosynthesis